MGYMKPTEGNDSLSQQADQVTVYLHCFSRLMYLGGIIMLLSHRRHVIRYVLQPTTDLHIEPAFTTPSTQLIVPLR
jgi:hypothetical protein